MNPTPLLLKTLALSVVALVASSGNFAQAQTMTEEEASEYGQRLGAGSRLPQSTNDEGGFNLPPGYTGPTANVLGNARASGNEDSTQTRSEESAAVPLPCRNNPSSVKRTVFDSRYRVENCSVNPSGVPTSFRVSVCHSEVQDGVPCDGSNAQRTRDFFNLSGTSPVNYTHNNAASNRSYQYRLSDCQPNRQCQFNVTMVSTTSNNRNTIAAAGRNRANEGGDDAYLAAGIEAGDDPQREEFANRASDTYQDCLEQGNNSVNDSGEVVDCDGNVITTVAVAGACRDECTSTNTVTYTDTFQCVDRRTTASTACSTTVGYSTAACGGSDATMERHTCTEQLEYDTQACIATERAEEHVWTCPIGEGDPDSVTYDPETNTCGYTPQCPTGYEFDGAQCRLDAAECQGGTPESGAIEIDDITADISVSYSGGTLRIGNPSDNYYRGGRCTVFTGRVTFRFKYPDLVNEMILRRVKWDDHFLIRVNGTIVQTGPNEGGNTLERSGGNVKWNSNPDRFNSCERSTSWNRAYNVNVTPFLNLEGENTIEILTGVGDGGEVFTEWQLDERPCLVGAPCATSDGSCSTPGRHLQSGSTSNGPESGAYGNCELRQRVPQPGSNRVEYVFECTRQESTCSSLDDRYQFVSQLPIGFDSDGDPNRWENLYFHNQRWDGCGSFPSDCTERTPTCVDSAPRNITSSTGRQHEVDLACWARETEYTCGSSCERESLEGCTYTGYVCYEEDPQKEPDPKYGQCTQWEDQWQCPDGEVTQCNQADGSECSEPENRTCVETNPDGTCARFNEQRQCTNSQDSNCRNRYGPECTETGSTCTEFRDGVCVEERKTYSCTRTREECNSTTQVCEDRPFNPGDRANQGSEQAAEAFAALDAANRAVEAIGDPPSIRVFSGKVRECDDPDEFGGGRGECCETPPDDGWYFNGACTDNEIELASARVAGRSHRVDRYCTRDVQFLGCVTYTEYHCVFDSMLARLIQQQGRQQLARKASSGNTGSNSLLSAFSLYDHPSSWHYTDVVGSGAVGTRFAYFNWPEHCAFDGRDPTDHTCPHYEYQTFLAACSGGDCGTLPPDPRMGAGSSKWVIHEFDGERRHTEALTSTAVADGQCTDPRNCRYTFTAWDPADSGDSARFIDFEWPLYAATGGYDDVAATIGKWRFQGYSYPINGGTPTQTRIRVEENDFDDDTANPVSFYTLPLETQGTSYELPTSPPMVMFGSCDVNTSFCKYRIRVPIDVQPKPWVVGGGRAHPGNMDCSGFTLDQFMALDLDRMDLSAWENARASEGQDDVSTPDSSAVSQGLTNQYESDVASDRQETADARETVARITPTSGITPWIAKLEAVSQYPDPNRPGEDAYIAVNRVTVNWGDGRTNTSTVPDRERGYYIFQHQYGNSQNEGAREYNVIVDFFLASGDQRRITGRVATHRASQGPPSENSEYGMDRDGGMDRSDADGPDGSRIDEGDRPGG